MILNYCLSLHIVHIYWERPDPLLGNRATKMLQFIFFNNQKVPLPLKGSKCSRKATNVKQIVNTLSHRRQRREDSTYGSSYMRPAPLGTGSWAARLLIQGILSQWLHEAQYGLGFQSSHTCKTISSGQFYVSSFILV